MPPEKFPSSLARWAGAYFIPEIKDWSEQQFQRDVLLAATVLSPSCFYLSLLVLVPGTSIRWWDSRSFVGCASGLDGGVDREDVIPRESILLGDSECDVSPFSQSVRGSDARCRPKFCSFNVCVGSVPSCTQRMDPHGGRTARRWRRRSSR